MTDTDAAELEVAEDILERMVHQLESAAFFACGLAAESDDDDDDEPAVPRPGLRRSSPISWRSYTTCSIACRWRWADPTFGC